MVTLCAEWALSVEVLSRGGIGILMHMSPCYFISDAMGWLIPQAVFGPHSEEPGSTDSTVAPMVRAEAESILHTDHKPKMIHAGKRGRDKLKFSLCSV